MNNYKPNVLGTLLLTLNPIHKVAVYQPSTDTDLGCHEPMDMICSLLGTGYLDCKVTHFNRKNYWWKDSKGEEHCIEDVFCIDID